MRWGTPRYHWVSAGAGLLIAFFATVGAVRIFVTGANERSQEAAARQFILAAGRIEPEYLDDPTAVAPAPEPITITLTTDRSAPVLSYLEEAGLDRDEAQRWAWSFERSAASDVLQSGHSLTLYKDPEDGSLRELKYDLDDRVAVRAQTYGNGVIRSSQELITYVLRPVAVAFKLKGDFWREAARNDLPQPIVATLASAFKDEHPLSALPRGSAVKLIYQERVSRDGTSHLPTGLEAAQISFGNKTLSAFAFRDDKGEAHLYDADGEALEPQSLRFPVEFQYISSGFSFHRYHPILHEYRPHVGVDLAAHYGTPVKAIGDGRIESAGWCGELGRCVKINHAAGMVSIYGHLSEITPGLQAGNTVRIGEVIGRVGSSGLSTGSHLHFAIQKDGQFVNPLTASLGTHNKISPAMRTLFDRLKQKYVAALDRMPQISGHFGSHFSMPFSGAHSAVARAESASGVSAAVTMRTTRAVTVRTIATGRSGLLVH